jgi:hypothetical protein
LLPADALRRNQTAQVAAVLVVSGIGGFHAGMVTFPDWQVAVETAQVVAGIVRYPVDNPFYLCTRSARSSCRPASPRSRSRKSSAEYSEWSAFKRSR